MVRIDLVRDKIRRLNDTVAALEACIPADPHALAANRDELDLESFRVYLGMQEAIDLCSHVIADQGWGPAPSLRDHFTILAAKGVLEDDLARSLAAGVKIRNLIGHAYADIDRAKLREAALELIPLLRTFCAAVLDFAESASQRSPR